MTSNAGGIVSCRCRETSLADAGLMCNSTEDQGRRESEARMKSMNTARI